MTDTLFPVEVGTGNALSVSDMADLLLGASSVVSEILQHLKFSKSGEWEFGIEGVTVNEDEVLAVNPASFVTGWQGWNNGVPVDGPFVSVTKAKTLPLESELPPIPDGENNGWNLQLGVGFRLVREKEEDCANLQFRTHSSGGLRTLERLRHQVAMGMKEHSDAPLALVKLSNDSYKHSKFGKIYIPVITIVGWADAEGKEVKKLAVK